MYDFITIDFETANNNMNSACSMGLVVVKGQEIVKEEHFFINPPTPEFNTKNISIHGITYDMVKDAGTFADVWQNTKEYFENTKFVIAHNAQFDMSALQCCLEEYHLDTPDFLYLDNIHIAHACSNGELQGNSLDAAAAFYSVDLGQHHNALDDARTVAAMIINILKKENVSDFSELRKRNRLHTKWFSELNVTRVFRTGGIKTKFTDDTIAMQELKSYASCIIADGIVELDEINNLADWIRNHPALAGYYPFDKISELCDAIFEDGIVSDEEREQMLSLLNQFVNPVECSCCSCKIDFTDKIFVLSGDFTSGSKKEVEAKITEKGGICKSGVTKKTDYLIVGGAGSDNWKFGNYGAKVSKALEMQENGHSIQILKESDLMNCL